VLNRILVTDEKKPAEVIFNFDPDEAGQKAAMRAFASAQKFNALTFIAIGPDGLDPCDLRNERGDEAILDMIAAKRPLVEFAIDRALAPFDLASREGQIAAVRAAAPIVAEISDQILRSSYEKLLSELTLVDRISVNQLVNEVVKTVRRNVVSPSDARPEDEIPKALSSQPVSLSDPINRRERWLLEVVAQLPEFCDQAVLARIFRTYFSAPRHLAISKVVLKNFGEHDFQKKVSDELSEELSSTWREILMANLPVVDEAGQRDYALGVIGGALMQTVEFEKKFLLGALTQAQAAQKTDIASEIAKKLVELDTELLRLRAER
jgi:DNA primase